MNVGAEYDVADTGADKSLGEFLQQVALIADADTRSDDEGLVTLMTLHNAKGLEYPIVFMIGCEEGVFPHSRALDEGGLEEERRLCYVGITRAERDLYICYARTRTVFGARNFGAAEPLRRRDPRGAHRPRSARRRGRSAGSAPARPRGHRRAATCRPLPSADAPTADPRSGSATTSSTPRSARAWSPGSSPAGSS